MLQKSQYKHTIITLLCVVAPMILTACDSSSNSTGTTQTGQSDGQPQAGTDTAPGVTASTSIGEVLTFGAANRTLYTFDNDTAGVSNCNGGCASTWPPITASGAADAGVFSTVVRDDGSHQWALNNYPLYYYQGDAAQGEVNGEGIGGVWHAARLNPIAIGTTQAGQTYIGRGTINNGSGDASTRNSFNGFTLYTFRNDSNGVSVCNDGCAGNWPPLYADNGAKDNGDFTVITRDDNTRQWAVEGRPLYFYQGDTQAGDTSGNGVGGVWDIAQPTRSANLPNSQQL